MFKGYVPTKGKRPTEKIRGRSDFYSLEDVSKLNEYGGVLSDDLIMIDIDDSEASDLLFKIVQELKLQCNVEQTTRGKHFYFKNGDIIKNCIGKPTAIGILADIKLGSKNAVVPLKLNGKIRKFLLEVEELDKLPKWLNIVKSTPDFNNLEEGDGRNQILFNYILTLQAEGFGKLEIKETLNIINNFILKEPIDSKELEVIMRDEAFQKPTFFHKAQLLHDKFAAYLKNENNVIKINSILHIYADGVYKANSNDIEKAMINYIPTLTKSKRAEVLSYLELIADDKALSSSDYILVNNGLYNLVNDELIEFNTNYIAKNKIPVSYNPSAYSEVADLTLNKIACDDVQLRALLEEMIGYTLLRRNELGKCFILTGSGSNGKSTLLDVIKKLLGSENCSSISLEEISQRFKTAELYGKLANIADDISNKYLEDNATFKKLVTGETVNAERKGKDPFDFNNYSKLLFSANDIPRINDTSNGLMRRLIIVPFKAKFSKKDKTYDPFVKDKLMTNEALEYLLEIGIQGLKRVLKNRGFTEVESVAAEITEYEKINNPVIAFLDDAKVENEATKDVYLQYGVYCIDNRLKPLSNIQFSREICKHGFKTKQIRIDAKKTYIFMKVES